MIFQECDCWFCAHGYQKVIHTFEKDGVREFWVDIPKNASASIKARWELGEKPSIFPKALYKELDCAPLAVYRDPMDRFVSLLNHYLTPSGSYGRFKKGTAALADIGVNINEVELPERISLFMGCLSKLTGFHQVHHFYPQTFWLPEEFEKFTWIPMNKVSEVFDALNTTPGSGKITKDMLTETQKHFILNEYKDDYDYFKDML